MARSKWAAPPAKPDHVDDIINTLRNEGDDEDDNGSASSGVEDGSGDEYREEEDENGAAAQDRGRDDAVFK